MSIYATNFMFKLEIPALGPRRAQRMGQQYECEYADGRRETFQSWEDMENQNYRTIIIQGVPGHIGHPKEGYEKGDPYSAFLPPVLGDDYDGKLRAVVVVMEGFEEKEGQRYTQPLLTLTGEEYAQMPFPVFMERVLKEANRLLGFSDEPTIQVFNG